MAPKIETRFREMGLGAFASLLALALTKVEVALQAALFGISTWDLSLIVINSQDRHSCSVLVE